MSTLSIRVEGPDQVGEARRFAAALAMGAGLDAALTARLSLVITECASNLWKHAGGGEILLDTLDSDGETGMEILALDKGAGMANVAMCFQDGYSTAGSPGTGLGAIQRLSSECDVYTVKGKGTVLLSRVRNPQRKSTLTEGRQELAIGAVSVPKRGEELCGDGYAVRQYPDFASILVVDGLGHGPLAAECAVAAVAAFSEKPCEEPGDILSAVHGALRATRGAAAAVARLDLRRREIRFAGIGNIAGVVVGRQQNRQMVSQPGIVGHDTRNVREFTYPWQAGELVLLYSDGIATHWSLNSYEGLAGRDPSLIAGVLYRDWNRGRDDATILAIRERMAP